MKNTLLPKLTCSSKTPVLIGLREQLVTCQIRPFLTFRVRKIAAELEESQNFFHCFRKHLFVLHHPKFGGNSSQKIEVIAIYALGTLNVPLILFSKLKLAVFNMSWLPSVSCYGSLWNIFVLVFSFYLSLSVIISHSQVKFTLEKVYAAKRWLQKSYEMLIFLPDFLEFYP